MALNCTIIQSIPQNYSESSKEYTQKWRELAARVHLPLVDCEYLTS